MPMPIGHASAMSHDLLGRNPVNSEPGYRAKMSFIAGAHEYTKSEVEGCGSNGKIVGGDEVARTA